MDDMDRAQAREEQDRRLALQAVHLRPARDIEADVCRGCDYATPQSRGKQCDTWADCLADLDRRERRAA